MASVTIIPLNTSDSGAISRVTINTNFDNINAELANSLGYTGATANLDLGTFSLIATAIKATASSGLLIESANGTDVGILGIANTSNVEWYGSHNFDTATADTIASFGASKTLTSLSTATYPSLTELSYVKGVTSALQTQINAKAPTASPTFTGTVTITQIDLGNADTSITRVSAGVAAIEGNNIVVNTSSPTLATITTTGNIELGNASDTTLSRLSAGTLGVEGIRVQTTTPLVVSATSYTTDTGTSLNMNNLDMFVITAQAGALLFNAPGGTLVQGRKLIIRIKDNGTARALTWNAVFRAMGTALPSTTVLSKTLYLGFIYNSTDTKWDLVASAQEI